MGWGLPGPFKCARWDTLSYTHPRAKSNSSREKDWNVATGSTSCAHQPKFFATALLDCNHQQSFLAHTTYPHKITCSNTRSHIRGKTLLSPSVKIGKLFDSCSKAPTSDPHRSGDGLAFCHLLPFRYPPLLCSLTAQLVFSSLKLIWGLRSHRLGMQKRRSLQAERKNKPKQKYQEHAFDCSISYHSSSSSA